METSERKWTDYTDEEKLLVIDGYLDGVVALDDENENANKQRIEWIRAHIPAYKVNEGKNYIFVSYSHLDYKEVYKDLAAFSYNSQRRVRFWYDEGLPIGQDWEKAAGELIKNPHCVGVLFYLSKNLLLSPSVFKEIEYVKKLEKPYCTIALNDGLYSAGKIFDKALGSELRGVAKYQDNLEAFFPDNDTALSYSRDNVLFRIDKIADAFDVTEEVFSDFVCEECDGGLNLVAYRGNKTEVHIPERIGDKDLVEINSEFPNAVSIFIPKTVVSINYKMFDSAVILEEIKVDKDNLTYYDINGTLCQKKNYNKKVEKRLLRVPINWVWQKQFVDYSKVEKVLIAKPTYSLNYFEENDLDCERNIFRQLNSLLLDTVKEFCPQHDWMIKNVKQKLGEIYYNIFSSKERYFNDKYFSKFARLFYFIISYLKAKDKSKAGRKAILDLVFDIIDQRIDRLYNVFKGLKKYSVFSKIERIERRAFIYCKNLDYLILPDSVMWIGCSAFEKSNLKLVFLPEPLGEIEERLFCDCRELLSVLTNVDYYETHGENTFNKALLLGKINDIYDDSFRNTAIEELIVCSELTGTWKPWFHEIECSSMGISQCSWLRKVQVPGNIKSLISAFNGCLRLWEVLILEGVESLIDCFEDCLCLCRIIIPKTLKFLGGSCFRGCPFLHTIEYSGTIGEWKELEEAVYKDFDDRPWKSQGKGVRIICSDGVIEPSYED